MTEEKENNKAKEPEKKAIKKEEAPENKEEEQETDSQEDLGEDVKNIKEEPAEDIKKREGPGFDVETWSPKTEIGRKVKSGEIKDIDELLDKGITIMEPEIVDILLPNLETDLLMIGQSKGKFGGGQRRVFKQTQKKTQEGNKPKFATFAVVGNRDGYVGVGYGKSKETVPAREKAIRKAKLNVIKIMRSCGSWECGCNEPHSIPFAVEGKSGSVKIKLMPAPKGKGLIVEKECQKILGLAGINDIWSKSLGQTGTKTNLVKACMAALKQFCAMKVDARIIEENCIISGRKPNKE